MGALDFTVPIEVVNNLEGEQEEKLPATEEGQDHNKTHTHTHRHGHDSRAPRGPMDFRVKQKTQGRGEDAWFGYKPQQPGGREVDEGRRPLPERLVPRYHNGRGERGGAREGHAAAKLRWTWGTVTMRYAMPKSVAEN